MIEQLPTAARHVEGAHVVVRQSIDPTSSFEGGDAVRIRRASDGRIGLTEKRPSKAMSGTGRQAPHTHRGLHQRWRPEGVTSRLLNHQGGVETGSVPRLLSHLVKFGEALLHGLTDDLCSLMGFRSQAAKHVQVLLVLGVHVRCNTPRSLETQVAIGWAEHPDRLGASDKRRSAQTELSKREELPGVQVNANRVQMIPRASQAHCSNLAQPDRRPVAVVNFKLRSVSWHESGRRALAPRIEVRERTDDLIEVLHSTRFADGALRS